MGIKFSVIVPCIGYNQFLDELVCSLDSIRLSGVDFEAIVLPDNDSGIVSLIEGRPYLKVIETGQVAPGNKRNIGASAASGDYLLFFDDDSFPAPDYFLILGSVIDEYSGQLAFGGPGITPFDDGLIARAGGYFLSSKLLGGAAERYRPIGSERFVDDWPSVNLVIRSDAFERLGGFNESLWPGEDSELCARLVAGLGSKILYVPKLVVFHHRRNSLASHVRQLWRYGLNRGSQAADGNTNSVHMKFAVPALFTVYSLFLLVAIGTNAPGLGLLIPPLILYLALLVVVALGPVLRLKDALGGLLLLILVPVSHYSYGAGYISGLFVRNIPQVFGR